MKNPFTWCLMAAWLATTAVPSAAEDPYPWDLETGREAVIIGTGTAALVAGLLVQAQHATLGPEERAALDRADIWSFDRGATRRWSPGADRASDWVASATMVAPVGLMVTEPGSRQGGKMALIYGETMLLNMGMTALLKGLVSRPRPYMYNDDPRIPESVKVSDTATLSFPSGHTSNAFAAMVFFAGSFAKLNPDSDARGWVWGGCLAAATTTGVLRYVAGRHYPTDILAGAALGAVVGWLVPHLHEVDPAEGGGSAAKVQLGWGFAF